VSKEPARPIEHAGLDALLHGYLPTQGVYDEMIDARGQIRPHWLAFVERLAAEGPNGLSARFEAADRYLKDSGVFYRVYDDPAAGERPWPLSHVPLLISPEDWKVIEAGVIQRAELIEAILADCYGPRELVKRNLIPAAAVAGSPDYLRPLVDAARSGQRHLYFYAIDLGRSPTGQWWVIRDRTQAPSGAGYALENRVAISRAVSDIYRTFDVERLAPFFDRLRAELAVVTEADDAGVCLLSPGPLNETYFEHTYLARYLGIRLVEGMDLMVQGGAVYLRTIRGLRKVRVLLRRIDGDFADPLELNSRSQLGVPGLVQAVREGQVTIANSLGAGFAEGRALLGFLPALAEPLLGQSLKLPNVATWWCGQPAERRVVLDNLADFVIAPAFSRMNGGPNVGPWVMSEASHAAHEQMREAIGRRGIDYVGQEVVKLSTTPVWSNGRLEPHPFIFRVYVGATANGLTVMPGGFALIGDKSDLRAVSMQKGARSADVWVMSKGPVEQVTLMPPEKQVVLRRAADALPSRAADNLFWLARYVERAEATLRLVRALVWRISERREQNRPDMHGIAELLFRWGAAGAIPAHGELVRMAQAAISDQQLDGAVPCLVRAGRRAASVIRDRFPADAWRTLDDLDRYVQRSIKGPIAEGVIYEKADRALRSIAAVTGFQLETMNRLAGWRFLKLGLRIERAIAICRFTRQFAGGDASVGKGSTPEELDLLLELCDVQATYRARYRLGASFAPVLDLVILDDRNPRSLVFQIKSIQEHAEALPLLPPSNRPTPALAVANRLLGTVTALDPGRIRSDDILGIENSLMQLSDEIAQSFFRAREPVAR
jgi:uncharacterized circularly permuted ATP-grasp superfamily protein/uncharacterized alpha-E superfamily protein